MDEQAGKVQYNGDAITVTDYEFRPQARQSGLQQPRNGPRDVWDTGMPGNSKARRSVNETRSASLENGWRWAENAAVLRPRLSERRGR